MLHIVAINPFVQSSVSELLAQIAKIIPMANLGNSMANRETLYLTYKYKVTKVVAINEPRELMMIRSMFHTFNAYAVQT